MSLICHTTNLQSFNVSLSNLKGTDVKTTHHKAIFISDIHLGSTDCKAELLLEFLTYNTCDTLYLVGDIVDLWAMQRQFKWPEAHNAIFHKIIELSHQCKVIYLPGNHDAPLQKYDGLAIGDIQVVRETIHVTQQDKRFLVLHGDRFDDDVTLGKFESWIGDFDDALSMLQEGWFTTGDFRQPTNSNSWAGTSAVTKIGINAVSTCEINNNEKGCDSPTGMFVSPLFKVNEKNPFLSLLMSGGDGTDDIRLELVDNVSNKILLKYSPNNCTPSFIDGNDDWVNFDLSEYIGRQLQIRIIDQHTKGCGFVSFDHIHLRETPI